MKIVVCIKQVPDTKGGVVFNPDGTLNRGAMLTIMNPDDKAGLEAALRLTIADTFHIKQDNNARRLSLAVPIFVIVGAILVWAKIDPKGFNILWRYFAWSNQTMALFPLAAATIYLIINKRGKWAWMTLIPGVFYTFICACYILNAKLGFGLSWNIAYIGGAVIAALYAVLTIWRGKKGGFTPADPVK